MFHMRDFVAINGGALTGGKALHQFRIENDVREARIF